MNDSNTENVIVVEGISKCYKVFNSPADRFKQFFTSRKKYYKEFWSLADISFSIKKGEIVGIVGNNGAGKSTLLQIIAGTLSPTNGSVQIKGSVRALLELGSGFNPEFTGRENVILSGTIYGISEKEMQVRMGKIEQFADIGEFIDQPVKTYSSGMFARLAFAVNINVDADILIVDEVLSVGDHFFQAKCMKEINRLANSGTTILMVSHSQATIKALCNRSILLYKGNLELDSYSADEVMDRYFSLSLAESKDHIMNKSGELLDNSILSDNKDENYTSKYLPEFLHRITERFGNQFAEFTQAIMMVNNNEVGILNTGDICTIRTWVKYLKDIDEPGEIGVVVKTFEGVELFAINTFFSNVMIPKAKKGDTRIVDFTFPVKLGPGKYSISLGYRAPIQGEYVDKVFNAIIFDVVNISPRIVPLIFDIEGEIKIL